MTSSGGINEEGIIFSVDTDDELYGYWWISADTNDAYPWGSLILSEIRSME